jgi:hypothetical protein
VDNGQVDNDQVDDGVDDGVDDEADDEVDDGVDDDRASEGWIDSSRDMD